MLGQRGTVAKISPGLFVSNQEHYGVKRDGDVFIDMVNLCTLRVTAGPITSWDGTAPPLALRVTSIAFQAGMRGSLTTWR